MSILKFALAGNPDRYTVEADMTFAIFAAECIYGQPRVRMEASCLVDDEGKACVIKSQGEAGDAAARIFAGLTAVRLGQESYSVQRVVRGAE